MNQLKTNINGKFPFVLDDIRFTDETYRKAFNAILSGLMKSDGIIYGCNLTIAGNEATIEEGAIWLKGELLQVPKQTFNYVSGNNYFFKLSVYFLPEGSKVFGDGSVHDTYEARIAVVHDGGSSTSIPDMIGITSSKIVDNAPGRLPRISTGQWTQNGLLPNAVVGTSSSGALVSCIMKSAFNKDFGTEHSNVSRGDHTHGYEPLSLYNNHVTKRLFLDIGSWDMVSDPQPTKIIDLIDVIDFDLYRIISVNVIIFRDSGRYAGTFHNVKDDMKISVRREVGQHGYPDRFQIKLTNYKKTFVNEAFEGLTDTSKNRGIVTVIYY